MLAGADVLRGDADGLAEAVDDRAAGDRLQRDLVAEGDGAASRARLRRQRVAGLQVLQGDRDLVGRAEPEGRC